MLWVGGPGSAIWPDLPNQRINLTPSQPSYLPGETASVFIPNDLGSEALALVTIEREEILRHEIIQLDEGGSDYSFPWREATYPISIYPSLCLERMRKEDPISGRGI
jgi:uncharacterized protein YfaS (alpha-2-macroglobulin family)